MIKVLLLALAALMPIAEAVAGDPQNITVRPGLVELRLRDVPPGSDVSWEARDPLTADFRCYEGGTVLVTYLVSGSAVFASDVIDWEHRRRDRTTWIVTIDGEAPRPPKPNPDPPKPNPDPPGLAGEVARMARAIGQPEIAGRYATAFRTAIAEINGGGLRSPLEARDRITALCTGISPGSEPWRALGAFIAASLKSAKTLPEISAIFAEAMTGLEAAGGAR